VQNVAALFGLFFENLFILLILALILQLVFCYALQTIADKEGVPATWLAWVPLLQIYPLIRSGGSPFSQFLLLLVAGIAACIASAAIGPLGLLLALVWGVCMLVYFGRLFWTTAENRGVSGWIGLLAFLPLVNLFAYLYIAFHDGPVPPHKVGVLLGILCFVLPSLSEVRKAREIGQLGSQFGPMAAAAERDDQQAMARMMHDMLQKMQSMEGYESAEGEDAAAISRALSELASAMGGHGAAGGGAGAGSGVPPHLDMPELEPASDVFDCPEGARERGAMPPRGFERWCERLDGSAGIERHGGYASWHPNGQLREVGTYQYGEREGVWTRWYSSGGKRTQAEFKRGLQHGFLLTWDEFSRPQRKIEYRLGEPMGG
jgi:hypothetical protein